MPPRKNPVLAAANAFATDARLAALLDKLVVSPSLQKKALANPVGVLEGHGIDLPPELTARFGAPLRPRLGRPGPDWEPFSIILTRCYTVYVRDPAPPRAFRKETVCFGIEIRDNPVPGGPRG